MSSKHLVPIDLNGESLANALFVELNEAAAPSTPASGKVRVYAKTDGKVYIKDDAGTETDITTPGSGGGSGSGFSIPLEWSTSAAASNGEINYDGAGFSTSPDTDANAAAWSGLASRIVDGCLFHLWKKSDPTAFYVLVCGSISDSSGIWTASCLQIGGVGSFSAADDVMLAVIPALTPINTTYALPYGPPMGLLLSNHTDADHDISISPGAVYDSTNTYVLRLATDLVKQIDAPWAEGTNQGGMATGTVANNTWYHIHAIRKDSDGTTDAIIDTSATAANIPSGWTAYYRLTSVRTNGSANINPGTWYADGTFAWATTRSDQVGASIGTTAALYTLSVPSGVKVEAHIRAIIAKAAAFSSGVLSSPDGSDDTAATVEFVTNQSQASGYGGSIGLAKIITNTSSQIRGRASAATSVLYVGTIGWREIR